MSDRVAKEVAEAEFDRMCAARRVCTDQEELEPEERDQIAAIKKLVVRSIMRCELVVNEDGRPVFTPPGGKSLTFHKPTGATFMAMDARGKDSDGPQARMARAIAEATRTPAGEISKLEAPDFNLCQTLLTLFMAPR